MGYVLRAPALGRAPAVRRRRVLIWPLLFAGIFALFQYLSAGTYTNPETGRNARVALTREQEEALGLMSMREILSQSETVDSGPELEMVKRVSERLVAHVDPESRQLPWSVSLIRSDQANAFCLPGGKISVYTGMLRFADSEAALAAVLGHEIAHATARHGAQRLLREQLLQTAIIGIHGSLSEMDPRQRGTILAALGAGAQFGLILPYSRRHEHEADEIGIKYMARAGYNPEEAIRFWQRMAESGESRAPSWVSTHPTHAERIDRLREQLPAALAEYERARSAGVDQASVSTDAAVTQRR